MPITLAATALPLRSVTMVAALAVTTYLLLMRFYVPLPEAGAVDTLSGFNLHLTGMAISFAITAGMLGYFIARLARALRAQQAEAELERERALRDEGILAIATQAASTAHELNTPLSTMRTLLGELGREHTQDPALSEDFDLLIGQADRCRDILRELVKVGSNQLAGVAEWISVADLGDSTRDAFSLLRPEIEVDYAIDAGPRRTSHRGRAGPAPCHHQPAQQCRRCLAGKRRHAGRDAHRAAVAASSSCSFATTARAWRPRCSRPPACASKRPSAMAWASDWPWPTRRPSASAVP